MNRNDKDGTSNFDELNRPNISKQHKDRSPTALKEEGAILKRENFVTEREDTACLRENAVGVREDAAYQRERAATTREREICQAEKIKTAFDEHIIKLQQANAHLIVAALAARKLAEEIEVTKVQMGIAQSVAEKANLAQSVFINNMSHELRTPLNAILGFSQLLEMGPPLPTDIQTERLQIIIKAGWYLLELLNGILDHAAIESGQLTLIEEPVCLTMVILECLGMIESQASKRDIHINFIPFDSTWFVRANRIRVKQVLINLLSNAIKYNREHGTVEVKCTGTSERIRICIKDSGIGLSSEQMAQLFQRFNRLGQETGVEEGTGIGLVVAKQLIELMGGSINVESSVGVGSEFWVELIRTDAPSKELALQAHGNTMLNVVPSKEYNMSA